jgi:hypothetical protein
MANKLLTAVMLALIAASDPAHADLRHGGTPPTFTAAEQTVIDRNAALATLVGSDPWLVRRVLDAIAAADTSPPADANARDGRHTRVEPAPDPARNPDLDHLGRSSPEAAHDLFQLIKQAGAATKK